jgi:hypothetical protein
MIYTIQITSKNIISDLQKFGCGSLALDTLFYPFNLWMGLTTYLSRDVS